MVRLFLKYRTLRRTKNKIMKLYHKLLIHKVAPYLALEKHYKSNFYLTLPKRQQNFVFYDISLKKFFSFTSGVYLTKMGRHMKSFKRNYKNMLVLILQLKKEYGYLLKYIYLFYIKNFNYRQYTFFKKLLNLVNPTIHYLVHKQSFMPKFLNKRRIKRRILHKLNKLL